MIRRTSIFISCCFSFQTFRLQYLFEMLYISKCSQIFYELLPRFIRRSTCDRSMITMKWNISKHMWLRLEKHRASRRFFLDNERENPLSVNTHTINMPYVKVSRWPSLLQLEWTQKKLDWKCVLFFFPANAQFLSRAPRRASKWKYIFEYSLHHLPVTFSRWLAVDRVGWEERK